MLAFCISRPSTERLSILLQLLKTRELQAHVFLGPDPRKIEILGPGPVGPRPGAFSTNIQHPVCTWICRDHDLTTYNWLSREKKTDTQSFLGLYSYLSMLRKLKVVA